MEQAARGIRELQLQELTILDAFCKLCHAHRLRFFLTAGTLLGAVRHRGFIPWDDDIDIAMPREDYDAFLSIAAQELPPGMFLQTQKTDRLYPFSYAKIRLDGTFVCEPVIAGIAMHQGIYIDIFPLDACPSSQRRAQLFFKASIFFDCCILGRLSPAFVCGYTKLMARALYSLGKRLPLGLLRSLRERLRISAARHSDGTFLCTVGGTHGYPAERYRAIWFDETVLLSFEGKTYPCPSAWDTLLRNMYGNYTVPPDEGDRQGHFAV